MIFAAALFLGVVCRAEENGEAEARKSAEAWLGLVDSGKYAESWNTAAALFKGALSSARWEEAAAAARKPLGAVVSRKLKSAQFANTLPGAPDGKYFLLQYDTSFENKKEAVETITPMLDKDGQWRVSGYFVK